MLDIKKAWRLGQQRQARRYGVINQGVILFFLLGASTLVNSWSPYWWRHATFLRSLAWGAKKGYLVKYIRQQVIRCYISEIRFFLSKSSRCQRSPVPRQERGHHHGQVAARHNSSSIERGRRKHESAWNLLPACSGTNDACRCTILVLKNITLCFKI
jgi:hypothetical protein